MVDSAVNLSIGTELDFSGLERDLAALKDYATNLKLEIDTTGISRQLRDLESELDCIRVELCVDDSKLLEAVSKTYKVAVEFEPQNLDIKQGKVELSAETFNLDIDRLEKTVTDSFSDLISILEESERNAQSRALVAQSTKPLTDIFTGFFEGIGKDAKKGIASGLEDSFGVDLKNTLSQLITNSFGRKGSGSGAGEEGINDVADEASNILKEVQDIAKTSQGILKAISNLGSLADLPTNISEIVEGTSKIAAKQNKQDVPGGLARTGQSNDADAIVGIEESSANFVQKIQRSAAKSVEGFLVQMINNALSITPGQSGVIDIGKQITSLKDVTPEILAELAKKGTLQTAITATRLAQGGYGGLKGMENAVLSLDPTGVAKVVKDVITPLALTAAATQIPGAGVAVQGAVGAVQSALTPFANALGAETVTAISGAIGEVVGGLPLVGGQLEAGLVQMLTEAVAGAVASLTGLAATGMVGKGLQLGTGAAAKAIAPGSEQIAAMASAQSQKSAAQLLQDINKVAQAISVTQLPGTTSVFPGMLPGVKGISQLKGTLDQSLNVKGLQDVYKQLTGKSGVNATRKQLVASIEKTFEKDAKAVQQALAKVKSEGLKAGAQLTRVDRPTFNEDKFFKELKQVSAVSRTFVQRFDGAENAVKQQTEQGLEQLIKIVRFQLKAIETVNKEFQFSGKTAQKIGGYQTELNKQLQALQKRFTQIGGDVSKVQDFNTDKIRQSWKKTEQSVKQNIEGIRNKAEDSAYDIQRNVAEGSPGPTHFIRKAWEKTARFVNEQINTIKNAAEKSSAAVQQGVSPKQQQKTNQPTGTQQLAQQVLNQLTYSTNTTKTELLRLDSIAEDLSDGFKDLIGIIDDIAGGKDIKERLKWQQSVINNPLMPDEIRGFYQKSIERQANKQLRERGEATSNISTLVGATAFSFAPLTTIQTLLAPLAVAFAPLIAAFAAAQNTIRNFVANVTQLMQQITPIGIRFNSISAEQTKYLDKEIKEREGLLKKLEESGAKEQKLAEQRQSIAALRDQRAGLSPENLMAVPQEIAREYSVPLVETMNAYSRFVGASTGTALAGKGVEELFLGVSQAIAALGLNAQDAELVFLAFQQMMSKGQISAEELRQQLAERMPGAVQLFAEALNVSQVELNQLLAQGVLKGDKAAETLIKVGETLQERYSESAKEAGTSVIGAMTRIQNAIKSSQIAITELVGPAFAGATNAMAKTLEFFAQRAESIFSFIANLFLDVVLTMSVAWASVWTSIGRATMTAIAPIMAAMYKYLTPFAINIGVDFVDNFYSAITGKDVMSPFETMMKGVENIVWSVFTSVKALGAGVKNTVAQVMDTLTGAFGGLFDVLSRVGSTVASLGVPFAELATTFVFVNQTMAFFGINSQFIKGAADNLGILFAQVKTGASRMGLLKNTLNSITLGLSSLQVQLSATVALLLLMFAKSDFKDPLKVELDKTLQTLEKLTEQAKNYQFAVDEIKESTKEISKGFNVTFGISEALGGPKIMTDDIVRALRGDLGDAANQAAYGFLAVISAGIGVAMLPVGEIAQNISAKIGGVISGLTSFLGAAVKDYPKALLHYSGDWIKNTFAAAMQFVQSAGTALYKAVAATSGLWVQAAKSAGALLVRLLGSISPVMGQAASLFGKALMLTIRGLTTVFASLGQVIAASFAAATKAMQGLFASLGRTAGAAIPQGTVGGVAIIAATFGAAIIDVFSGGAVRQELTNLAKRFGLIAIAEMQAEQRRRARKQATTDLVDAVKQRFFVEFEPGQLEKELADVEKRLKEGGFRAFSGEKNALKQRRAFLKDQLKGQALNGRIFFTELTKETKSAMDELASIDKSIIAIQSKMNDLGKLSVQAEITGNTQAMQQYNAEYERLNQQLKQEISTRNALAKPYQDFMDLLKNARQALEDELNTIQSSGQFNPQEVEAINLELERVNGTIAALEKSGVKNLNLLQDEFNASAAAIERNNEKLSNMLREIDRIKNIQLANIAEAFASGQITQAQKDIRAARLEVQSLQKQLDVTSSIYQSNFAELEKLMQRPTQTLSDDEKQRQKELIASVKDQEMQMYQIRATLADATVQARETAESAMAASIESSTKKNIEAVMSEVDALTVLREDIKKTIKLAQMLSEEGKISLNFNASGIQQYQGFLESFAEVAARLGVDLGQYVQELGGFITEQQEIDRLLRSNNPADKEQGRNRQRANQGRMALSMESLKQDIADAETESLLKRRIEALQSGVTDVFEASASLAEAYIAKGDANIATRKNQLAVIAQIETAGIITRQQRIQAEKQLNDEIAGIEENLIARRAELLTEQIELNNRQEKASLDAAAARSNEVALLGGDVLEAEINRQQQSLQIIKQSANERLSIIENARRENKTSLDRGGKDYEEYIAREKELNNLLLEETQSAREKITQVRTESFEAINAAQSKEASRLASALAVAKRTGLASVDLERRIQGEILSLTAKSLRAKEDYLLQERSINIENLKDRQITYEEFLAREKQVLDASTDLAKERVEKLKEFNAIESEIVEAKLKGQERLVRATSAYSEALSKQGELLQVQARLQKLSGDAVVRRGEQAIAILEEQKRLQEAASGENRTPISEDDQKRLDFLRREYGIIGAINNIDEEIKNRQLEIAKAKAETLRQEQETQRKLLALEIERNKIAAQTAIKEAEIAAIRARMAVKSAEFDVAKAASGPPEEFIQAQLALQLAQEEFGFALAQLDINKQNAVINNRLAELEKQALVGEQSAAVDTERFGFAQMFGGKSNPFRELGKDGFGFGLDGDVQKLADLGEALKSITDFSKYDQLIEQLDQARRPIEERIATEQTVANSVYKLSGGVETLNQKIENLVNAVGRPNITINGSASMAETIQLMREANR